MEEYEKQKCDTCDADAFQKRVSCFLETVDPDYLMYDKEEFLLYQQEYEYIQKYACEKQLFYTACCLVIARGRYNGRYRGSLEQEDGEIALPFYIHCLRVCKMLIYLPVGFSKGEEDVLLAAALCHDFIKNIPTKEEEVVLRTVYRLPGDIIQIMLLLKSRHRYNEKEQKLFFNELLKNKFALLVRLSDQSDIVEHLIDLSIWKVHEYIYQTRVYYLPLCIDAKIRYHQLYECLGILAEKMRTLCEITDILVNRYARRETELSNEILSLREENARIRYLISNLKTEP